MKNDAALEIGFLGAGVMGAPMARRLIAAGFSIRIWNRTAARTDALVAAGASRASTPAEAADGADVVLACLTDGAALGAALLEGTHCVAQAAQVPARVIDFSTIGPASTRDLAAQLRSRCGASWVDAPVSGGAQGAEQGKLIIFCGGSPQDIAWAKPIFAALAQRVTHVGDLASGQTLKMCNQLIVASNLAAIAEALALARASGLEPRLLPEAFKGGFADSLPLQIFGRRMAEGITDPIVGRIDLMLKDLRAAQEMSRQQGQRVPVMDAALDTYCAAVDSGLAAQDLATLFAFTAARRA